MDMASSFTVLYSDANNLRAEIIDDLPGLLL